jgi:hypothetical protein
MNNKYIFYPNIPFDMDKITDIVTRRLTERISGYATHQRKVADEPYLVELRKDYPFFSSLYNIYATPPGYVTPIHICPGRGCAVNIPIVYTEDSHTIFYEITENAEFTHVTERIYDVFKKEDAVEVFRYTLDRPTLMNTKLPHGVLGGPAHKRIIMSWSIDLDSDYETTKKLLGG